MIRDEAPSTLYEIKKHHYFELPKVHSAVKKVYDRVDRIYDIALEGWTQSLKLRDPATEEHSRRAAHLAVKLARAIHVPEQQLIHYWRGGLLHDIGKLSIPETILLKPGKLTAEEQIIMQSHPQIGYDCLKSVKYLRPCIAIPHYHHERWDGSGYPLGLSGKNIPLEARIFAIADVWDALSSERPYRTAWPENKIRDYFKECAGTQFDPHLVATFLHLPSNTFMC